MRSVFKRLGSLIAIFCVLFLFQNCGKQLSVFSGHGNGDPYEGLTSGDGSAPTDSGSYPVQVINIETCTSSDPTVPNLTMTQAVNTSTIYLQTKFIDSQENVQEESFVWSQNGQVFGGRSVNWSLDKQNLIIEALIQPATASLQLLTADGRRTVSFTCRSSQP